MAQLPVITIIQASDAPQQTGKLWEILEILQSENRIRAFKTLDAEQEVSSLTDTVQEEDLILVVLTHQLDSQRKQIEEELKALKVSKPGVRIGEIIVDNVPYENEFITFPVDLRNIRDREDMNAVWDGIEQNLKEIFPVKKAGKPSDTIDWPKYLKVAGIVVGVILVFFIFRWIWIDDDGGTGRATGEVTEQMEATEETRSIWARGKTCLTPAQAFDLDRGVFDSDGGDLFYENVDGRERYLRNWRSSIARGRDKTFEQVSFRDLEAVQYGQERFDASYGDGDVRRGTTWFIRTSEGRYAKIQILQSGHFMEFEWITYAKEDDQGRLSAFPVDNGSCSVEEEKNCETGQLTGDEVRGFEVLEKHPEEAMLEIDLTYNTDHGQVIVVPLLLDANGENISRAYRPTFARQGETRVPVLFNLPGRARSVELFIYMFEHGTPGEAFICKRFPFTEQWG